MTLRKWLSTYPLTVIMIVCWIAGGAYFGSTGLYKKVEAYQNAPVAENMLDKLRASDEKIVPAYIVDPQWTKNSSRTAQAGKTGVFSKVDQSYLDDAVFIGDSRTDTLHLYAGWDNAAYYVKTGTNIWSIMSDTVKVDGKSMTIEKALGKKKFGKVYIMLGVNELGSGTAESFYQQFKSVVKKIRKLQPDAIIFVESIMHVTSKVSASSKSITNGAINTRNKLLRKLADNETIFFIDENTALDDENGALTAKYTFDGIHLEAKYIGPWKEFILSHGVVR